MRPIPGFPNYSITKDGWVWSKKREGTSGGWLSPVLCDGYSSVRLYTKGGKYTSCTVHRLALETFVGPCPVGMECRHLDGDRTNNNLGNLKWGTRSENMQDAIRHGTLYMTSRFGEDHPQSRLSNRDRRLIIYEYSTGLFTLRELGKIYGVHFSTIGYLVRGKLWPFVNVKEINR